MWKCPKCNALLVQKNLSHSCGQYTVESFLEGKSDRGKDLFWFFVREVEKIGPIILHPVKTRVALMVEVRFSAIYKIGKDHIDGHFWLKSPLESQKFRKIEHLGKDDFIHHFRLHNESDIDDEFRGFMRTAYGIGQRKHMIPKR